MVSAAVRAAAARTWSQLLRFVGPGRTGPVSLARLEQILGMIELFSNNNTNFNFHVHVSGYDTTGKIFWLPVFEDPNVVDSAPATQVLSMLYRYIESADGMMAASGSLLALKPRSAAACGGGEPLDIGHLPPTLGDELVASASQGAGGGEAGGGGRASGKLRSGRGGRGVGATGAAIGRGGATAGGAERAPNGVPSSVGTASAATTSQAASDDLARAQAAAAAVLEVDEDADDADGEVAGGGVLGPTLGSRVVAVGDGVIVRGGGVVMGGGGVVVGGGGVVVGGGASSGGGAPPPAADGGPHPTGSVDGGDNVDEDDSGNSSSSSSSSLEGEPSAMRRAGGKSKRKKVGGRPQKRHRWQRLAPVMHYAPANHIPTSDAKDLLRVMLDASTNRLTRLRSALVKGNAAVAGGMSTRRLRLCLPWWPRQANKDAPWPLGVVVDKDLIASACAKESSTIKTSTVTAVLWEITLKREATVTQRLAEFLLLADKSPAARASMTKYISGFAQSARMEGKARTPVLGVLGGLRTAPRIAPSPATLASLQAAPRRTGETFSSGPLRPAGFVPLGSPRPTHHTRLAPEELPAPLPPNHPAAERAAVAAATGTVTPATTGKATSDSASIRAALLARAAGAAAAKTTPSGTTGSVRAAARSAPPKSSTSKPAAPPLRASSTSASPTVVRQPAPVRTAAPPTTPSTPPSAPPRGHPARSAASGTAARRPASPRPAPQSTGSSKSASPVGSRPPRPAPAAPPSTPPSAPPSAPPPLQASAAAGTTARRPAPPQPPATPPSPPEPPSPGAADDDGVVHADASTPAGADSCPKVTAGDAPSALLVAAAAALGASTSGAAAAPSPSRTTCSVAGPAPSGGRSPAERSPPAAAVSSAESTRQSVRPSESPGKRKAATSLSGSSGLAAPPSARRLPLPPDGGTPRGATSLVTPAASSARRPPLPPRRSPPSSDTSRTVSGKVGQRRTFGVGGGDAAVKKGGDAIANAANARKTSGIRRDGNVGDAAAGVDGAATTSATGVRASLVDQGKRSKAATATGPSSSSAQVSLQGPLEAIVVAAAPRAGGKRTLTFASAASTAAAPRGAGGAAAATAGAPPAVATRRSKRGQRAADLAAAGLEVSDPAPAQVRKRAAATETGAASSPPRKRSRRLADRLVSTADDSGGPSTHTRSSVELAFDSIPNSKTCTLMSELSVPVATGRLVKDMHSMQSRRIDKDMVAVKITAVLDEHPYPYGSRYPLPGTGKKAVGLSSLVGSVIVWPINGLVY